ncbi:MAG: Maf family protein [Planctomycetota bacterium]
MMSVPTHQGDTATLILASRSERRLKLLREHGFEPTVRVTDVEDGVLSAGRVCPEAWTIALAYLKARAVFDTLPSEERRRAVVLAGDTVVERDGRAFGKPRTPEDARKLLDMLSGGRHRVISGICMLAEDADSRLYDSATIHFGTLDPAMLDRYIASSEWRGKAGGYNLEDCLDAGWPIEVQGDPATVMGLPMKLLRQSIAATLHEVGASAAA